MEVLVTGGAGYIGSHTAVALAEAGHQPILLDNLCNSNAAVHNRLEDLTKQTIPFYKGDVRNEALLQTIFTQHRIKAVLHFAALKAVDTSTEKPLQYYRNNLDGLLVLAEQMQQHNVYNLIFSSSATVYGVPTKLPLTEDSPTGQGITNPYGWTKWMAEQMLHDVAASNPEWRITILRYFNPIGAHSSGTIGEDPNGPPDNLTPYIAQVAIGRRKKLRVFGNDYPTPDGTCLRDYIHVMDVAYGHVAALKRLPDNVQTYNLGTGQATSVLEMIRAFGQASGKNIPYEIAPRRPGDIAKCWADPTKAAQELHWHAQKTIEQACQDAWHWQSKNPNGYHAS